MFVDNVEITVQAGKGGNGLASFRREKYLPFGGPDGGDGGKGGDIYLRASSSVRDLGNFRHKKHFRGENGKDGGVKKMHGADARDLLIDVPVGTVAYVKQEGKELIVADLERDGQKARIASGGRGGLGNVHFATATHKAPREAQSGENGKRNIIVLRLRLMVDVAILGFPNSGKSALLSTLSGARPEIADYPFTTREPVLGMVRSDLKGYTWAEIPAIVRNTHTSKGLHNRFLCHAERANIILYLLDGSVPNTGGDLGDLLKEVELSGFDLAGKKSVIVVNKTDTFIDSPELDNIKSELNSYELPVFFVSAKQKQGLTELVSSINEMLNEEKEKREEKNEPEVVFRPKPVDKKRSA